MDKNEFFREVTIRICSSLEIEKGLLAALRYIKQFIPVSRMAIERYDEKSGAMRTIAKANGDRCESVDLLTPLSEKARLLAKSKYKTREKKVYLFDQPEKDKLAREMLLFHDVKATSLMVLSLQSGDQMIGSLALMSEGPQKFTADHAELITLLSEPFAIALSNTLKHRNELKLFDREFFWEVTRRICGNLEIEEGLLDCFEYLSQQMPADGLYLQKNEVELGAMRIIARSKKGQCERTDFLIPYSKQARKAMAQLADVWQTGRLPSVLVMNKPKEDPITLCLLEALNEPMSSVMSLPLTVENQVGGALALIAEGEDRFTEEHTRLYSLLKEPFFVAISNAMKHEEILELKDLVTEDNNYLRGELRRLTNHSIVGADFGLKNVMHQVQQVSPLDSPVLLLGETGVGKDVIANMIHNSSPRSNGPFVSVNCGAIPESLIDSELFGHEKGAFTGALSQKKGRFERANKGTIFLDEIGELPLQAQVRLLRVLQQKEIERVGGSESIPLDIRIIAATNRNLEEMVRQNQFREDLWFRINVFPITIPPLRSRKSDIPALVQHFVKAKSKELKLPNIPALDSQNSIDNLIDYHWPGNVRELQNAIERALILNPSGPLTFEFLYLPHMKQKDDSTDQVDSPDNLDQAIAGHINKVLLKAEGKVHGPGGAAELLGVNPNTLRSRMKKLNISYGKGSN
jgi:transcriptional regulator with GAF, ATPase, and Fis domain